jgi:hypothetical protein
MNDESVVKSLVRPILQNPHGLDWSLQGFGMLRLYLGGNRRLHIWDERYANEGVSEMHTHPWDFRSLVVAGEVTNIRYMKDGDIPFFEQTIRCGEGGGLVDGPQRAWLRALDSETYTEQETYTQEASEIHVSHPLSGTVTIVKRTFKSDTEHAYVYWPIGYEWVTAEPRPASATEVRAITENALERWF